jgi:hypothetical protein
VLCPGVTGGTTTPAHWSLHGTYTLEALYQAVHQADPNLTTRADGADVIHGVSDTRWKRRVRGALQTMKKQGSARRVGCVARTPRLDVT